MSWYCDYSILSFPLTAMLAAIFIILGNIVRKYRPDWKLVKVLGSSTCGAVLCFIAAAFAAVEGIWAVPLHRSWPFAILMFALLLSSFLVSRHSIAHFGVFLILFGAFFGTPDRIKANIQLFPGQKENICVQSDGTLISLPYKVELQEFSVDTYEDGVSPKQFTSKLLIDGQPKSTSVNSPCKVGKYTFYQSGFDTDNQSYSILMVTRDPWHVFVLLGMVLLSLSSLWSLRKLWKSRLLIPICIVVAALFTVLSVTRISFSTLVPSLRSLWFVPHLLMYMLAYSLMAISLVLGIVSIFKPEEKLKMLTNNIFASSSVLLFCGMTCGAIWAKQAWGDYWTWDPKESWAAVTWLLSQVGLHIHESDRIRNRSLVLFIFIVLSFIALQITWYGVNYLPSASSSIHTYK